MPILAGHLIGKRGAVEVLNVKDKNGKRPADIAKDNQNMVLLELFTR